MQNWLGAIEAEEHDLLRDPHDVISALPADDAVAAVTMITEALNALNATPSLTLEERYDDIYLLDGATVERTYVLLREYLDATRQSKQREAELWNGAYGCWNALATAYISCVRQFQAEAQSAASFRKLAHVATARAIRALRRQLQWLRIRYAQPVPEIWTGLASLYAFIQTGNIEEELLVYPGENTTIKREFLKAVVQSALSCESLHPPGQDLATYILSRYSGQFVLSPTPVPGCTHWFDLKHPQPPALIATTPATGSDVLYFGAGTAVESVQQALRDIQENNRVPADLGFKYPIELSFLTERRSAFENLAYRVNLDAVKGVVTTMIQTERYGTPLASALRVLSAEFRNERMMRAEEKAARLPAIMTIPLILFILPVLFIVILGPAACSISDAFSSNGPVNSNH